MSFWNRFQRFIREHPVRVTFDHSPNGTEIPRSQVGRVLRALGLSGPHLDPEQLFAEILQSGESIDLLAELKLKRSSLLGEPAIELVCNDSDRFAELRDLGPLNEQIRYRQHFFAPADAGKGVPILAALLARYPVLNGGKDEAASLQESFSVEVPASETIVVDLEHWIVPPPEKPDTDEVINISSARPTPCHQAHLKGHPCAICTKDDYQDVNLPRSKPHWVKDQLLWDHIQESKRRPAIDLRKL